MATESVSPIVRLEYIPRSWSETKVSAASDPFHHESRINSHNHHSLHPWGPEASVGSDAFNTLYAQANNQYMYHVWYTDALAPFMATDVIAIHPLSSDMLEILGVVLHLTINSGIKAALASPNGKELIRQFQEVLDDLGLAEDEQIFVRLGATSAKDSWATLAGVPTMKPPPLSTDADLILHWLLTSGRVVGRLLALSQRFWAADPGEALIIQRWSPFIEARREFRVFCDRGRVTAICQDIWWEKLEDDQRYSPGFVDAIIHLWDNVKEHLPFDSCTMDVLMTHVDRTWTGQIVEFNGFGAHLNTGSDLFHWVHDAHILHGETDSITVRFMEGSNSTDLIEPASDGSVPSQLESLLELKETPLVGANIPEVPEIEENPKEATDEKPQNQKPDWLILEKRLMAKFGSLDTDPNGQKFESSERITIPLRGNWSSAY